MSDWLNDVPDRRTDEERTRREFEENRRHIRSVVKPVLSEAVQHLHTLSVRAEVTEAQGPVSGDDALTCALTVGAAMLIFGTTRSPSGLIAIASSIGDQGEGVTRDQLTADAVKARVRLFVEAAVTR